MISKSFVIGDACEVQEGIDQRYVWGIVMSCTVISIDISDVP